MPRPTDTSSNQRSLGPGTFQHLHVEVVGRHVLPSVAVPEFVARLARLYWCDVLAVADGVGDLRPIPGPQTAHAASHPTAVRIAAV